jgi:hypothetical protein
VNYARNGKQRGRDPGRDLAQRQNGSDLNLSGCRELGLQRRSSPMGASAADWGLKKKEKPEAFHFLWLFGVSVVGVLFPTGDTNRQGLLPPFWHRFTIFFETMQHFFDYSIREHFRLSGRPGR